MSIAFPRLFSLSHLRALNTRVSNPRFLAGGCYTQKRNVQEFPGLRLDNSTPKDYVLLLPEELKEETETTNELLRASKAGQIDLVDFSKLNVENVYKGLSKLICDFENFVADVNNETLSLDKDISKIFGEIERNLYPLDTAFNILMILLNVEGGKYEHKEISNLISRYYATREKRFTNTFRDVLIEASSSANQAKKLQEVDKKMLNYYQILSRKPGQRPIDDSTLAGYRENLRHDVALFQRNLIGANQLFSHTVDDPDILAAVASEYDDCQDLHHKERTPLQISVPTYNKFMQICPDRFVRQMLWQTYNKRCSPKALPKYNNSILIKDMRILRRKIADVSGYRSHLDQRMVGCMATSRQNILADLKHLNACNSMKMKDRLQELNDYAADNSFEDPNQVGIQEYDVDFWTHKYMHEILIGVSEADLKSFFPLDSVLKGMQNYFETYLCVEISNHPNMKDGVWSKNVQLFNLNREGRPLGYIVYDPYQRPEKKFTDISYSRVKGRINENISTRYISTSFKLDRSNGTANLGISEIINLFYCFSTVIQRLLYNYPYYELNTYGCLEADAKDLMPNLCVAHLLTDHKIIQSFSDRGGSKKIDSELASRITKAYTYFNSLTTWKDLYKAHLDIEAHTILTETKDLADQIYGVYSPFYRDPDCYDFCSMDSIFVGPNDGTQFATLWSRQLANLCLSKMLDTTTSGQIKINETKSKELYKQMIDSLFSGSSLNTQDNLVAIVGHPIDITKVELGVL